VQQFAKRCLKGSFRAKPLYDHQPAGHLRRENTAVPGEVKVLFQRFKEAPGPLKQFNY
jgi:hypothetical protein